MTCNKDNSSESSAIPKELRKDNNEMLDSSRSNVTKQCPIHPNVKETDICDMCLDTKKIVCVECKKDSKMLEKMGIISKEMGNICSECIIINAKNVPYISDQLEDCAAALIV